MVKKFWLIFANALLWMLAGANIARIGINSAFAVGGLTWLWSVPVFAAFFTMFSRTIAKNSRRIKAMDCDMAPLYRFMTLKGYLIIAFMMSLGIVLRKVGSIPEAFFSFFYTGLGSALFLAGAGSLFKKN